MPRSPYRWRGMDIELLTVQRCPHRAEALARLEAAFARALPTAPVVTEHVITNAADAPRRPACRGSPTILIDGRDPFGADSAEPTMSCRLYATEAGVDGAPSVDMLVAALTSEEAG